MSRVKIIKNILTTTNTMFELYIKLKESLEENPLDGSGCDRSTWQEIRAEDKGHFHKATRLSVQQVI